MASLRHLNLQKGKIASYFGKEIISNPGVLERSLFDNIIGFYASYISKHNLLGFTITSNGMKLKLKN